MFMEDNDVYVLGVSETWLLSSTPSSFVDIPGYRFLRKDVVGVVPKHGVGIYIKSVLNFREVEVPLPNVIVVFLCDFDIYILIIYRPPSNLVNDNEALLAFLSDFCFEKDVIIVGDFNLPTIKWCNDIPDRHLSLLDERFFHLFNQLGLTQWIREPTYYPSRNILDLILTNDEERMGDVKVLAPSFTVFIAKQSVL